MVLRLSISLCGSLCALGLLAGCGVPVCVAGLGNGCDRASASSPHSAASPGALRLEGPDYLVVSKPHAIRMTGGKPPYYFTQTGNEGGGDFMSLETNQKLNETYYAIGYVPKQLGTVNIHVRDSSEPSLHISKIYTVKKY